MMSSETPEDEPVVPEVTRLQPDEGWSSFASSLSQSEITLLESLLDGNRTYDIRMVDSINSKAMDTIGDTVIEDDSLIDDYRDDLRRALEG